MRLLNARRKLHALAFIALTYIVALPIAWVVKIIFAAKEAAFDEDYEIREALIHDRKLFAKRWKNEPRAAPVRGNPMTQQTEAERISQLRETIIDEWENRARCKFESAEAQPDDASRRFVEHGATCYFNCAQELRVALYMKA